MLAIYISAWMTACTLPVKTHLVQSEPRIPIFLVLPLMSSQDICYTWCCMFLSCKEKCKELFYSKHFRSHCYQPIVIGRTYVSYQSTYHEWKPPKTVVTVACDLVLILSNSEGLRFLRANGVNETEWQWKWQKGEFYTFHFRFNSGFQVHSCIIIKPLQWRQSICSWMQNR